MLRLFLVLRLKKFNVPLSDTYQNEPYYSNIALQVDQENQKLIEYEIQGKFHSMIDPCEHFCEGILNTDGVIKPRKIQ